MCSVFLLSVSRLGVFNMDLDRPRAAICRSLKGLVRFLKLISMRDQRLQVDDFVLQKPNRSRPRMVISVDELQIHLYIQLSASKPPDTSILPIKLTSASDMCMNGNSFMIGFPTPMTMTSPVGRGRYEAVTTLPWTPVHSYTTLGWSPPAAFIVARISSAVSFAVLPNWIWKGTHPGTKFCAYFNLPASRSVTMIGQAPEAFATARAHIPIGPAPQITVDSPNLTGLLSNPCRTTLKGSNNAPSEKDKLSGILCKKSAR